jgi:hypothetical protein
MDSTSPPKDTVYQTGLKRKMWHSVFYKRPILLTEINTDLGWKTGRGFTKPVSPENRVAILTSDKADFKLTFERDTLILFNIDQMR